MGKTLHSLFGIKTNSPGSDTTKKMQEKLKKALLRTLVLIIDERSMVSSDTLGAAEKNTATTAHGGTHQDEDWGGIPVVILVGDDYQIPPVETSGGKGKGAFRIMSGSKTSVSLGCRSNIEAWGASQFLKLSTHVMELTTIQRQDKSEVKLRRILADTRRGVLKLEDAQHLDKLHRQKMSAGEWEKIESVAVRIFANRAPMIEHNHRQLAKDSSDTNPVAFISTSGSSDSRPGKHFVTHFKQSNIPTMTKLCRNAKVSIKNKNFKPEWGLYNGAIGRVDEIVFKPGDNPNLKHMPLYVAVEFKGYCGPVWDTGNPKIRKPQATRCRNVY